MALDESGTYPPLNTLKAVAEDIWIVDGPVIRFGFPWPKLPFPTRMTVVRLAGGLFIHSPTPLTPKLRAAVEALGPVRWIIGPNRIHYWWIPEWRAAFPGADIHLAPRIREQAKGRISFPCQELVGASGYPWDGEMTTLAVPGGFMTEVEFFHRASRTLILTDLIENFEAGRIRSRLMRLLMAIGGVLAPNGQTPRDLRLTFSRDTLREAVRTLIGWNPERIIIAHGRWYERDGTQELRRAFHWLHP